MTNQNYTGSIAPEAGLIIKPAAIPKGTRVKAADQDNIGTVVADNGSTCSVHFVSKEGKEATEEINKKDLSRLNGAPCESALPPTTTPFEPFPTDALPEPLKEFVDTAAAAIGCDTSYVALPLLSALGAAIGNSHRLYVKSSWKVPAIIWTAVIGESGTAKSPAFKVAVKYVRDRQAEMEIAFQAKKKLHLEQEDAYELDLADWKKNRKKKPDEPKPTKPEEPICERVIVQDTTIEGLVPILRDNPSGVLVERDELAGWFGSFDKYSSSGQSDSAHWLSMFNADTMTVDRKTTGFINVQSAYVCVTGGIQPGTFARSLTEENKDSGLAARILMAYPPRKPKRWGEQDIDEQCQTRIGKLFDSLYELEPNHDEHDRPQPIIIGMDSEAKAQWIRYYDSHNIEQVETDGEVAAAFSKLEEYPLRFGLIFHLEPIPELNHLI